MGSRTPEIALATYVATHKTNREAAAALGISAQYLGDMLRGQRKVSNGVLAKLGLERVVTIRKVKVS